MSACSIGMTTRKRKNDLQKIEDDRKKRAAEPTAMREIHCSNPGNRPRDKITGQLTIRFPITLPNDDKWRCSASNVMIGGFGWKIRGKVNKNNQFVSQIQCNSSNLSMFWICKATCEFGMLDNSGKLRNNSTHKQLFRDIKSTVILTELSWPTLISDSRLVKDDHVTLQIDVTIDNHAGLRKFTPLDFSKPTPHSDVILLVGQDRFHVNKTMLAMQSTFFEGLFFSDFAEKDKEEVKLNGMDPKKFTTFLHFVYHSGYSVTDDNHEYLLELADMFQVTSLLKACEDFLCRIFRNTKLESLRLADKYALPRVLMCCIESFKDAASVKAFTKQKGFEDLNLYTQLEIFKKITQFDA